MMRSSEKHVHVALILIVFLDVLLTLGGTVNASGDRNEADENGGGIGSDMGGKAGEDVDDNAVSEITTVVDDSHDLQGEMSESNLLSGNDINNEIVDDPVLTLNDLESEERADFGKSLPGRLSSHICIVKWLHTNKKVMKDMWRLGQYDTVGTIISRKAVLASPPGIIVPLITEDNADISVLTVKSILFNLHNRGKHLRVPGEKMELFFHPRFSLKRDTPHHFILIYLQDELPDENGFTPALLVTNPMSKYNWYKMNPRDNDDYAVSRCELVMYNKNPGDDREIIEINMVLTKCTHVSSPDTKAMWDNRMCGLFRMVSGQVHHLAERLELRWNDVGNPLFCYGSFVGMFMGVQNIYGNHYGNRGYIDPPPAVFSPEHLFSFEILGTDENYKFIRSLTSVKEGLRFSPSYPPFDDNDTCVEEIHYKIPHKYDPGATRNTWIPGHTQAPYRNRFRADNTNTTGDKAAPSLTPGIMSTLTVVAAHLAWCFL